MASYLPDDFIDTLREQTDIVEVIGHHVELRKRGQNWVGLCPFHTERTPSFTVTPSKDIFKCFGCGKGGDVYTFLMEHQQLSFTQAVEQLAERAGIAMPRKEGKADEDSGRKRLFYANEFALEFYHAQLLNTPGGKPALQYLRKRGLSAELIAEFGLGWAPNVREGFHKAALAHGIEEPDLVSAGLLGVPDKGGASYDRFRNRVLFPIRDSRSRVIGFGGRVLDDSLPKYLNTSDTELFHKGEVLFGLDKSRGAISRDQNALVVEGYMDLLSLWQAGVQNVVAPLGTALTAEQARLLGRYAKEVFLLYDPDRAGLKATFRGGDELLAAGVNVRVATLPGGLDPDEYIRKNGPEKFAELIKAASDFMDRKIEIMRGKLDCNIASQKEKAIEKCMETVVRCSDKLILQLYLEKTAEFVGFSASDLVSKLGTFYDKKEKVRPLEKTKNIEITYEERLIGLCIKYPSYIELTIEKLGMQPFRSMQNNVIFKNIVEIWEQGIKTIEESLYNSLDEAYSERAKAMKNVYSDIQNGEVVSQDQIFEACWRLIEIDRLNTKIKELKAHREDQNKLKEYLDLFKRREEIKVELSPSLYKSIHFRK